VPFLIVASAGTSNAGMVDPLNACAELAARHRLWYHVDAAWGGAIVASERLRAAVAGLERADSATIDAHKWFATTMGCGMFIVRDPAALTAAFQVAASYMPSREQSLDPYMNSVQWSRRFLGLRLFLSLASAGWAGHAAHIERAVALTAWIRTELERRSWSVVNDSPLALLNVVPPAAVGDPRSVVARHARRDERRGSGNAGAGFAPGPARVAVASGDSEWWPGSLAARTLIPRESLDVGGGSLSPSRSSHLRKRIGRHHRIRALTLALLLAYRPAEAPCQSGDRLVSGRSRLLPRFRARARHRPR
jgi:hypothetical protein